MDVLSSLHNQKRIGKSGGIYARTQQLFAYHSNVIEGSRLSFEQTCTMFEINALATGDAGASVDDIIEILPRAS